MNHRSGISPSSPFVHLLFLALLITVMAVVSVVVMFLIARIFGIPANEINRVLNNPEGSSLLFLKLLQAVQTILLFLVPAILLPLLIQKDYKAYLFTNLFSKRIFWFLTPLFVFFMVPVINVLAEWNSQLQLPENLSGIEQWMREKEEYATHLLDHLLRTSNGFQLAGNIVLIAVLPAIAEEFLFRGALQRIFIQLTRNVHIGIVITAILFSAIHMQFLGFIPRFLLGLLFGYLLIWSGSIWIPVLAHFTNNFMGVLYYHFYKGEIQEGYFDTVGATSETRAVFLISVLIAGILWYLMFQQRKNNVLATIK